MRFWPKARLETKRQVYISGPVDTFTGYGQALCEITASLVELGFDVALRAVNSSELFGAAIPLEIKNRIKATGTKTPFPWELAFHSYQAENAPPTARYTMHESTVPFPGAVDMCNQAEVVVLPCQWCAACYSAAGVQKPIHVIPLGTNPQVFNYAPMAEGRCIFGTAGRVAHGGVRKGIGLVTEAFCAAFPAHVTDVELRIKCHPDCAVDVPLHDKRIVTQRQHLSWHELRDWLSALTCFVSGATAEGFGLWQLQSLQMGRPVIACAYSGVADFLTSEIGYPVSFDLEPASAPYLGQWAKPSKDGIAAAMVDVYRNRNGARRKGMEAALSTAKFTWSNTSSALVQLLERYAFLPPLRR